MPAIAGMAMPMVEAWTAADFAAMLAMWSVMMAAMMLPAATPVILLYARVARQRAAQGRARPPVPLFVLGYLLAWSAFSVLATSANWALHAGGFLSSMMGEAAPRIGGVLLILAGLYQWTPLKDACLTHCRSPFGFLADHWRDGPAGALAMGAHHGAYCIGCCWLLMALLFVLGVMNLAWIAVLTVFVLLEKAAPHGRVMSRAAGVLLLAWGAWLVSGVPFAVP